MQDTQKENNTEKILVSLRIEKDLDEKINEMRKGTERNKTQQIKFMLRQYIKIKENE